MLLKNLSHNMNMINELINEKNIEIYLQAIVSIKDNKIFAFEALTRAFDRYGESISPLYLFEQAKKENLSSRLDAYVRELALLKFSEYYRNDHELLLFLKFESSVIENEEKDDFISIVYKYNISPSNIVIEIKEDRIKDTHALQSFLHRYKSHNFLIAIDDFGTGYSSFNRLEFINPDIVKIDRSLIYNVDNNFINCEILTAISNMCANVGAMVLAEGVESRDEVLTCMQKDINVFQGYWFNKPQAEINEEIFQSISQLIKNVGNRYKEKISDIINKKQALLNKSKVAAEKIVEVFKQYNLSQMNKISEIITQTDKLEAIYLLDMQTGLQIGDTMIDAEKKFLYNPAKDGYNHSFRKYYFITKESVSGDYLSPKYLSKASGNICHTYSCKIIFDESEYILCCDVLD